MLRPQLCRLTLFLNFTSPIYPFCHNLSVCDISFTGLVLINYTRLAKFVMLTLHLENSSLISDIVACDFRTLTCSFKNAEYQGDVG
jgi:hypothetical protein